MYRVELTPSAEADMAVFDRHVAQRILKKLRWLAENIDLVKPEALTGPWQGVFKLRVGNYRVLYTIHRNEEKIIVHLAKHRREVYRT